MPNEKRTKPITPRPVDDGLHVPGMCKYCDRVREQIAAGHAVLVERMHKMEMPEDHPLAPDLDKLRDLRYSLGDLPASTNDDAPAVPVPEIPDIPQRPDVDEWTIDGTPIPEHALIRKTGRRNKPIAYTGWAANAVAMFAERLVEQRREQEARHAALVARFRITLQKITGVYLLPDSLTVTIDGVTFATDDGETLFVVLPCQNPNCDQTVRIPIENWIDLGSVLSGLYANRDPREHYCSRCDC